MLLPFLAAAVDAAPPSSCRSTTGPMPIPLAPPASSQVSRSAGTTTSSSSNSSSSSRRLLRRQTATASTATTLRTVASTATLVAAATAALAVVCGAPAAVFAQGNTTTTDPCSVLAPSNAYTKGDTSTPTIVSGSDLFACYNSFSVSAATRKAQTDGVKAYFDLYPYLDLAKSSSSPLYSSNVDIFAALDAIAANDAITTEFALHTAIADLIDSLNDAHSFYASLCFATGRMIQPFIIDAKYNTFWHPSGGSTANLRILAGLQTAVHAYFNKAVPNYSQYVGYTVSKINGVDAVSYIQQFADKRAGVSHSPETRFNSMLPTSAFDPNAQNFMVADGPIYRARVVPSWLPLQMTYDLVSPSGTAVTVSNVPWAVYVSTGQTWSTRSTYYQLNCVTDVPHATPAAPTAQSLKGDLQDDFNHRELTTIKTQMPANFEFNNSLAEQLQSAHLSQAATRLREASSSKLASDATFSINSPLVSDENFAFYQLDADTGVWAFTTVNPATDSNQAITAMVATAASGLKALETAGVSKLIIDTIGNGGGIICVGLAFLQMLFPSAAALPYDLRLSSTMQALIQYADSTAALRNQGTLFSSQGQLVSQSSKTSNILSAPKPITRGGATSSYSDRFDLSCTAFANEFISKSLPTLTKGWSANAVALVSDGNCGSTCAEMTRVLRDQIGVKAYVVGGSSGAAFQPSSFEGGSVGDFATVASDSASIAAVMPSSVLSGIKVPDVLPLSATGSLPVWESYSPQGKNSDSPVEWVPQPADGLLAVQDITDRSAIWKAATAAMGTVVNTGMSSSGGGAKSAAPRGVVRAGAAGAVSAAAVACAAVLAALWI